MAVQQCKQCVLDTNDDPGIQFSNEGICSYCIEYSKQDRLLVRRGKDGEQALRETIERIKKAGRRKKYDCILGVSGGVDSTYLAYLAKSSGLRILAVHFDNGWNSELAVQNIERVISTLGIELYTYVVDWDEFKDVQLAFLKASVIDLELPTDHAMLATLYRIALEQDVTYILSGHNIVTEYVLPKNWYFNKRDHIHIKDVHCKFGTKPLQTFPLFNSWLKFRAEWRGIKAEALLNLVPYNKTDVKKLISEKLGWRDYGGKHYESIFTRFYQGYILPTKFGVDKRRAHLSNLICSGQISRDQALLELDKPIYDAKQLEADHQFVLKKLNLSAEEFERLLSQSVKKHSDYAFEASIYDRFVILRMLRPGWKVLKKMKRKSGK